jgi:tRNA G18 (ribose-2'-O)-methylase SpoU
VKIPMKTGVESLNVATAAALMVYEVRRSDI